MSDPLRILHLEDDQYDAELARAALELGGLRATIRRVLNRAEFSGALALETYDLILADYKLPGFDGRSALEMARQQHPEIPFLFVSGTIGEETAIEALKQGATDYILKDRLGRLVPSVIRALNEAKERQERKRAQEALRQQERFLASVFASIQDGIVILNNDYDIVHVNPTMELWYAQAGPLVGRKCYEVFHQRASICEKCPSRQVFAAGLTASETMGEKDETGKTNRWVEIHSFPLTDAVTGKMTGVIEYVRDVTRRKEFEEQIHQQAALLDLTQDAIAICDLGGRLQYWNRGAELLFGWTQEEIAGRKAPDLLYADDETQADLAMQQTLQTGSWNGELRKKNKANKKLIVQSRWTLMRDVDDAPQAVLVVDSDITEKKQYEGEMMRMERLESIGRLASGIAHDLNNVLSPIMMAVPILRDEIKSPDGQSILDHLATSAKRGSEIVKQILIFARGLPGQKTVLQPRYIIQEVGKIIQETFPKALNLQLDLSEDLWTVLADAAQIKQVLMNLSINARDAMPDQGTLTLRAENQKLDENFVRMAPQSRPGCFVMIGVRDTGTGILPDILDKIFDPFFTTKTDATGTGLGLSTSLGIVKDHDGFFQVQTQSGQGSEFRIYLPAVNVPVSTPSTQELPAYLAGHGECILVIDDEPSISEITKKTLEKNGYRVLVANDGAEGIAQYAQNKSEIALVITDMAMPHMDGPGTMRALQKMDPNIKLIAASGLGSKPKGVDAAVSGAQAFLHKPFTAETLLRAIHHVLHNPKTGLPPANN